MFACVYSPNLKNYPALVDCAYAFSPLVEETARNTVVLDIEGCELLFGSPREIAKEIARHAGELGLKVNVAVAQNPDAAIQAARCFAGITVIPPGKEINRLGNLPLVALDAYLARVEADRAAEILETLELWGIRSFREFAALPEAGVSERLGPEGVRLQKLARGESERPLLLSKPAPGFEKSIDLDDPIELHHGYARRAHPPVFRFVAKNPIALTAAHSVFDLNHHVVLATRYRRGIFGHGSEASCSNTGNASPQERVSRLIARLCCRITSIYWCE